MVAEEEPVVRTHLGEQFRGVLGVLRAAQDVRNAQQRRARVEHRDQPHAVRQIQPAVPHQPRDRDVLQTTVVRGRTRSRGFILDASLRTTVPSILSLWVTPYSRDTVQKQTFDT